MFTTYTQPKRFLLLKDKLCVESKGQVTLHLKMCRSNVAFMYVFKKGLLVPGFGRSTLTPACQAGSRNVILALSEQVIINLNDLWETVSRGV